MQKYNHQEVEKKWKKNWEKSEIYKTKETEGKPKYYVLDMFPYPSGAGLHVGHPKGYIATDIVARMKMMQGFNVLHPMGWDAFGLPAENYALKNKVHPSDGTAKNVATFKKQLGGVYFSVLFLIDISLTKAPPFAFSLSIISLPDESKSSNLILFIPAAKTNDTFSVLKSAARLISFLFPSGKTVIVVSVALQRGVITLLPPALMNSKIARLIRHLSLFGICPKILPCSK